MSSFNSFWHVTFNVHSPRQVYNFLIRHKHINFRHSFWTTHPTLPSPNLYEDKFAIITIQNFANFVNLIKINRFLSLNCAQITRWGCILYSVFLTHSSPFLSLPLSLPLSPSPSSISRNGAANLCHNFERNCSKAQGGSCRCTWPRRSQLNAASGSLAASCRLQVAGCNC